MGTRTTTAAAAVALLLAGCAADESSANEDDAPTESVEDVDGAGQMACDHFRNVARDADAGILSQDELREKVQEVHSHGQASETEGIPEGTEDLLAAVTQEDDAALGIAVRDLADACEDAGA